MESQGDTAISLPETRRRGEYSRPTQTQSAKICTNFHLGGLVGGWGGGGRCISDQLKPKVPRSVQIFTGEGGGVYSRPTFLKYLSGSTQGIFNQKFWLLKCVVHHR